MGNEAPHHLPPRPYPRIGYGVFNEFNTMKDFLILTLIFLPPLLLVNLVESYELRGVCKHKENYEWDLRGGVCTYPIKINTRHCTYEPGSPTTTCEMEF